MQNQLSMFSDSIEYLTEQLCAQIAALPLAERVTALNQVRTNLHAISPFQDEPIDCVLWVPGASVQPNAYNPNVVYSPEMKLLEISITEDHYTQPVVTHAEGDVYRIVDGEHRYLIGTGAKPIVKRLSGYLPVTVTHTRTEKDHMASTIRHNRARGVHKLDGMSAIVSRMLADGWRDDQIADHLGMDADEILRLKQVSGIAGVFARAEYNRAWINDDGQSELA